MRAEPFGQLTPAAVVGDSDSMLAGQNPWEAARDGLAGFCRVATQIDRCILEAFMTGALGPTVLHGDGSGDLALRSLLQLVQLTFQDGQPGLARGGKLLLELGPSPFGRGVCRLNLRDLILGKEWHTDKGVLPGTGPGISRVLKKMPARA